MTENQQSLQRIQQANLQVQHNNRSVNLISKGVYIPNLTMNFQFSRPVFLEDQDKAQPQSVHKLIDYLHQQKNEQREYQKLKKKHIGREKSKQILYEKLAFGGGLSKHKTDFKKYISRQEVFEPIIPTLTKQVGQAATTRLPEKSLHQQQEGFAEQERDKSTNRKTFIQFTCNHPKLFEENVYQSQHLNSSSTLQNAYTSSLQGSRSIAVAATSRPTSGVKGPLFMQPGSRPSTTTNFGSRIVNRLRVSAARPLTQVDTQLQLQQNFVESNTVQKNGSPRHLIQGSVLSKSVNSGVSQRPGGGEYLLKQQQVWKSTNRIGELFNQPQPDTFDSKIKPHEPEIKIPFRPQSKRASFFQDVKSLAASVTEKIIKVRSRMEVPLKASDFDNLRCNDFDLQPIENLD